MISIQFTVEDEEQNIRIDKLLVDRYPEYSRSVIQKWIKDKFITVNGKIVKANYRCETDDQIIGFIETEKEIIIKPENILLEIIYEDNDLLIVNKPKGMVVHPSNAHQNKTLVNALRYHYSQLSSIGGVERPGIVHRIDKDTSGLLVVAKNDDSHKKLTAQFMNNEVKRVYEAIVHRVIEHNQGTIDAPIGRDPKHRLKMAVVDQGKSARTHFHVVKRFNQFTLVQCQLETGRTHQIRVHMDYIGHSLLGDPKYSQTTFAELTGQALYAKSLSFIHPSTKQEMHFEIEAPNYFQHLLKKLEK